MARSLLDLPDDLLLRCMCPTGGQGVAYTACCCKRLHLLAQHLSHKPIFCSGMSVLHGREEAIRDATTRAMAGCWGAIDFALIFVANFGLPKKYTDPCDASHAVDMLRVVLGRDVPIVGCACSGLMGVGPDSLPCEVDPACNSQLGRAAARLAQQQGRTAPHTRGVTVLLGKMPPGCAVRAFASATAPAGDTAGAWPEFDDALALTNSQRAQLAAQLAVTGTAVVISSSTGASSCGDSGNGSSSAAAAAAAADGTASPATAAAATSLLSVAAGSAAAAVPAATARGGYGDVHAELVPQLCLLLYRSAHPASDELQYTLEWMKARQLDMQVVGGASSGAGDLLFSPGAYSRLAADPPANPAYVGLLLCSASSVAGGTTAAAQAAAGDQKSSAAGGSGRTASAGTATGSGPPAASPAAAPNTTRRLSSRSGLSVASMSVHGLQALPGFAVYTDLAAELSLLELDCYKLKITLATQVPGTAGLPGSTNAVTAGGGGSGSAATGPAADAVADAAAAQAGAGGSPSPAAPPERRSQRVAAASTTTTAVDGSGSGSGVSLLSKEFESLGDLEIEHGVYAALWRCPAGAVPGPFTGMEEQLVVLGLYDHCAYDQTSGVLQLQAFSMDTAGEGSSSGAGELPGQGLWEQQDNRLCMQFVIYTGQGSAGMISRGLPRLQQQLHLPASAAASGAAAGGPSSDAVACRSQQSAGGGMADCYAALAANAAAAGARSGLDALAVFSCTMRGQQLYSRYSEPEMESGCNSAAFGAVCEAVLVDEALQQGVPFVGVYVDGELGPPVRHGCLGWGDSSQDSMPQAFTSMFAAFGFLAV